jgi:NADH-quinone oxidoreductase subunit N
MNKKLNNIISISLIFGILILINLLNEETIYISNDLLISNNSIILVKIILLLSSSIILLLPNKIYTYEFGLLILLSTIGMMLLISSNDLIMLYLSIELISLSLYILTGINKDNQHSTEAGLKYFLLGALSSGLILFGMGLLYGYTGETNISNIGAYI